MKKIVLILLLQISVVAAMAGGGPDGHVDSCNPKPKKTYPASEGQKEIVSITSFESKKNITSIFSIVEKYVAKVTQHGNCEPIVDILGPKTYELIYREFSVLDYKLIRTITVPLKEDELVFDDNSVGWVIGLSINNSDEKLDLECQMTAVPSGFEDIGFIKGDIFGVTFKVSNQKCTSNLPVVDDVL
ncbi:hypothetical protein K2X05_01945 [bacterium]|nr:hypothetical protein [bacterium]